MGRLKRETGSRANHGFSRVLMYGVLTVEGNGVGGTLKWQDNRHWEKHITWAASNTITHAMIDIFWSFAYIYGKYMSLNG